MRNYDLEFLKHFSMVIGFLMLVTAGLIVGAYFLHDSLPPEVNPKAAQITEARIEQEPGTGLAEVSGGTSLSEVVAGLNALGVAPHDMIDILKAINAAGALHAEFVVN